MPFPRGERSAAIVAVVYQTKNTGKAVLKPLSNNPRWQSAVAAVAIAIHQTKLEYPCGWPPNLTLPQLVQQIYLVLHAHTCRTRSRYTRRCLKKKASCR